MHKWGLNTKLSNRADDELTYFLQLGYQATGSLHLLITDLVELMAPFPAAREGDKGYVHIIVIIIIYSPFPQQMTISYTPTIPVTKHSNSNTLY